MFSTPNMLCYFRILVIPVIMVLFFYDTACAAWLNVGIWILAGASDYLDGYIARKTGKSTQLGKFLDSSSDKMLIMTALLLLCAFGQITGWWLVLPVIIMLREILISGMREFIALSNVSLPVSKIAKWKTTVQMVAIGFLMAGEHGNVIIPNTPLVGLVLLAVATVFTVISGWGYLRAGLQTIMKD